MQFQTLKVLAKDAGKRIDVYLSEQSGSSRSQVQAWIKAGEVRLNQDPITKNGFVVEEDMLLAYRAHNAPSSLIPEELPLDILFENEEFLVLNKDAGQVVHPDSTGHQTGTIAHAVLAHCQSLKGSQGLRPGIVHRLDKDTSGALLVAKTQKSLETLSEFFHDRKVRKVYWALVKGTPKTETGTVDAPIKRSSSNRQSMAINAQGRSAVTHFKILESYGSTSLLEVHIETGRTHQIRLHLASIGHPVLGDPVYGDQSFNKICKKKLGLTRQFLHAKELAFGEFEFTAPLKKDLENVLDKLRPLP